MLHEVRVERQAPVFIIINPITFPTGIGAAIAEKLASKGASIVLNYTSDTSKDRTYKLATDLQHKYNVSTMVAQADLGSTHGPANIIEIAKQKCSDLGFPKFQIDIIINNAGISENKLLQDVDLEHYDKQYNVNVRGPMLLVQAALKYLPHDRSGRIVNVSSVSCAQGPLSQTVYAGTKGALEAMTRVWARELAERATVNAVNPGPVSTDMVSHVVPVVYPWEI